MISRKEQKENTRNKFLEVSLDLFIKKGYGACRIADIAKTANISTGLLFHYFDS